MVLHVAKRRKTDLVSGQGNPKCASPNPPTSWIKSTNHENSGTVRGNDHASTSSPVVSARVSSSSLWELQVDEMLAKIRPGYGRRTIKAEDALRKLKRIIDNIPECEAMPILEAEDRLRDGQYVAVPFPHRLTEDCKYTCAFRRPTNINVVGSYGRKTAVRKEGQVVVDLAITMPSELFQAKDYLDYRYFNKRAFYLANIAGGIQKAKDSKFTISYAYQGDNPLQPILIVHPSIDGGEDDFSGSDCRIRILIAVDEHLFPVAKTTPNRNCVRDKFDVRLTSEVKGHPTSFYNATIRAECATNAYLKLLHASAIQSAAFERTCMLGSIWLQQRGLGASIREGGFGQFEWAAITSILFEARAVNDRPVLSSGSDYYQLFKAVLQYLAGRDLMKKPMLFGSNELTMSRTDMPMFYDGVRGLNILYKMTSWSYRMLRYEAGIALAALNASNFESIEPIFIAKVDGPLHRFDLSLRLPIRPVKIASPRSSSTHDHDIRFCDNIHYLFSKALGDRVNMIYPRCNVTKPWAISSATPSTLRQTVLVGLLLNPEHLHRAVDHGPPAEEKEAAEAFRKFWGAKAELRRFKDGSILESLLWIDKNSQKSVLEQIITYTLNRHIGEGYGECVEYIGPIFDRILTGGQAANSMDDLSLFQPMMSAYDKLEKSIRELGGLPLQVRKVSAVGSGLRYASVFLPMQDHTRCQMQPVDVCVQFEGSARWPDDLLAIQRTKVAFLIKIAELLSRTTADTEMRLGLENATQKGLDTAFLDIVYATGYAFRLRIHHDRELTLLERMLRKNSSGLIGRQNIANTLSAYRRNFIQGPLQNQSLRALCTRFPLLSPCIRLIKHWRNAHLLSPHISGEFIELLAIRTFVTPWPWQPPGSIMTGFLRTLTFISKWDWRSQPLIVDFNGRMSRQDFDAINVRFEAWRKIDPTMNRIAVFAASNIDPDGITWTEQGPHKVVAARFRNLARAACDLVKRDGTDTDPKALFTPSMADYDFVVHLKPDITNDHKLKKKNAQFKNLQTQAHGELLTVGFDPVKLYLDELRAMCGRNVIFFYNEDEGRCIAALWNPQTRPRPWKLNLTYSTSPMHSLSDGSIEEVGINKTAILNDITRLAGGMVSMIEVKRG